MATTHRSLDDPTRQELRARLLEARSRLLRTMTTTTEELETLEGREPGAPMEDAAREEILGILARLGDREQREMQELDAAFGRLHTSVYGVCERCGGHIPVPRLRAMPTTRYCVTCQAIRE